MKVVSHFYSVSEEDMENKQNVVIDDAKKLHPKDQKKRLLVDKSSKGRQVTFENDEVETDSEAYVTITEYDSGTEKSHKRPKVKMPKNVSVLVNDENDTYLEEKRRKKIKVDHS